jgi:hypothetical protein
MLVMFRRMLNRPWVRKHDNYEDTPSHSMHSSWSLFSVSVSILLIHISSGILSTVVQVCTAQGRAILPPVPTWVNANGNSMQLPCSYRSINYRRQCVQPPQAKGLNVYCRELTIGWAGNKNDPIKTAYLIL